MPFAAISIPAYTTCGELGVLPSKMRTSSPRARKSLFSMNLNMRQNSSSEIGLFSRYGPSLLMGFCILLPLKLSLAYICGIPYLLLWIGSRRPLSDILSSHELQRRYGPLIVFFLYAACSSLVGLDFGESLKEISSLAFFSLLIPAVVTSVKSHEVLRLLSLLLLGQTVASLHSILQSSSQGSLGKLFVGTVSESGQLSVIVVICFGYALQHLLRFSKEPTALTHKDLWLSFASGAFFFFIFLLLGFSEAFGIPVNLSVIATSLVIGGFITNSWRVFKKTTLQSLSIHFLLQCVLPACTAALLVNLKRGPWLGVICALTLLLLRSFRRGALVLILLVVSLAASVGPIYTRLIQSVQDFRISGGREIMWQIGAELSLQFPLGIGYANSPILQAFSAEIPKQLKHFHNNALNIIVETGWIGLFLFCWWVIRNVTLALSWKNLSAEDCLSVSLCAGILSWQLAGIVEYNFGDSEVAYLAFLIIAIQMKLGTDSKAESLSSAEDLKEAA